MSQSPKMDVPLTSTKYRPIAELGRGGMATVYLAVAQGPAGFNKLQVLKRLRPALAADPEFLQMFLEEARLSARINHANVVQTNEVGFDGNHYYIAMEYLDGQPLESILRRTRERKESSVELPLTMHLKVIADALAGLHFAHELSDFDGTKLNVVHRDMSPHNVMVTYEGSVKVLDFGIAKAADSSTDTRTGIMKGKCAYMAAEQFGGKNVDRRADIFAVGVMLWQAATGRRLWQNLGDAEIFAKLAKNDIPRPRDVNPSVSEELETIIVKALSQKPEDRYSTAAEFQAAIEEYMHASGAHVTPRELGKFVADLFADRRATIKEAIEAQLKNADAAPTSDVRAKTGEVPLLWSLSQTGSDSVSVSGETLNSPERASIADVATSATATARRGRLVALGALALAALGLIGFVALKKPASTTAAVSEPADSAAPVATESTTPLIQVTIQASPAEAKIFLDDAELPANPASSSFVRDGASHVLRIEAPGYTKKIQRVTFDTKSLNIDIALDRENPKDAKHPAAPWHPAATHSSTSPQRSEAPQQTSQPPQAPTTATAAPASSNPPDIRIKPHGPALDTSTDPWSGSGRPAGGR